MQYGISEELFKKIIEIIKKYNKYEFVIFGSRARGDYKKGSDIDIAIKNCIDENHKFDIMNDFDLLMIPYKIDLIFIQDIKRKEFLNSIERNGKLLYE